MRSRNPGQWSTAKRKQSLFFNKKTILAIVLFFAGLLYFSYWYMVRCEGEWNRDPLEKSMAAELIEIKKGLEEDVAYMQDLGPRNPVNEATYSKLLECEKWIRKRWESQGYAVKSQTFLIEGKKYTNLEIEFQGRIASSEIIIISAQYDSLPDSPGANNNASGMAVLLSLSNRLRNYTPDRTLRLVAFVNEEDPFFDTEKMGSYYYARRSHQLKEDIRVMLSLDALGIYTDTPGSQKLPFPFSLFYPDRGNFLAFIGDLGSRKYIVEATRGFKKGSVFPIEAGVVPKWVKGAGWSDHLSFWKFGYPGIMVTDTGGFRSPYHTTKEDTMEKLNFEALSRIVLGMYSSITDLTRKER